MDKLWTIALFFVSYLFAAFALYMFRHSFFLTSEPVLRQQAIYWFYSAAVAAILPLVIPYINIKYKDWMFDFNRGFKRLDQAVEKQTLKIMAAMLSELSEEDYLKELERIFKKERQFYHCDPAHIETTELYCRSRRSCKFPCQ